ncbi:ROK family protein [Streptomyces sp. NPDC001393]
MAIAPPSRTGPLCHCGNRACVEAISADPAILRAVRAATGRQVSDAAEVLAPTHGEDPGGREVCTRAGEAIGKAIGFLANILGPARCGGSASSLESRSRWADSGEEADLEKSGEIEHVPGREMRDGGSPAAP